MHSNNDGMDPNWRPPDSDSFSETQFARAERLSRELYFSNEKLKKLEIELARIKYINKKFKIHGTDGCKSCETGRVTLFIANDECISCNPESYEIVTPDGALNERINL